MFEVHAIDLQYLRIPKAIAAYVAMSANGPVLIETGPASTLPALNDGLAKLGLKVADIRHALLTHIHLDHAGAAGHLAQHGTQIYVHHLGAPHLIDSSKLIESARRIYGDQMDRLWGRLMPIPQKQITALHDGDRVDVCGLRFTAIETPGHAKHHHAFALANVCFTGDIAGITVPGVELPRARFIAIPAPPPEFDPAAWRASLARLESRHFAAIYPTHFGVQRHVAAHLERVKVLVNEHAEFVRSRIEAGQSRAQILNAYIAWQRRQALADGVGDGDFARYVSNNLLTMNVDGIIRYWTKSHASQSSSLPGPSETRTSS